MQRDRPPWSDSSLEEELSRLPLAPARDGFRDELKRRFVGAAPPVPRTRRAPLAVLAARPAAERHAPVAPVAPARDARRSRPLVWAGVAASLIAALFLLLRERPAKPLAFTIRSPEGDASALVDGLLVSVPAVAPFELPARSERIEARDRTVWLQVADQTAIECPPGTALGILRMPSAADATPRYELALYTGLVRVVTGPSFAGSELWITTKDARVEVTGTQFAVELRPDGTCVCCRNGRLRVHPLGPGGVSVIVAAQSQHLVLRSTGQIEQVELDMSHIAPLVRLAGLLGLE